MEKNMDEFLTEPLDWLDEVMESVGYVKTAIIPVLQSIQTRYKFLPERAVMHISEKMDIPMSKSRRQ